MKYQEKLDSHKFKVLDHSLGYHSYNRLNIRWKCTDCNFIIHGTYYIKNISNKFLTCNTALNYLISDSPNWKNIYLAYLYSCDEYLIHNVIE